MIQEPPESSDYNICKHDPLIKLFTRLKLGPVELSVAFLVLVVLFTAWLWYADTRQESSLSSYLSYKENISWFLSLIFIFPFVLGLVYKYYQDIPLATFSVYKKLGDASSVKKFDRYWSGSFAEIDQPTIYILAIVLVIVFNSIYFFGIYVNEPVNSWMLHESASGKGDFTITVAGWVAVVIQVLLMYWLVVFVIKGLLYIRHLHQFFAEYRDDIAANPLHEDGLSGLSEIARLATWQATIILLLGIYVSLKVIDKSYFQEASVLADPGNMAVLISYVLLAPLMFFMLLGAAHGVMRDAKQAFLAKFNQENVLPLDELQSPDLAAKKERLELLQKAQECRDLFDQRIRVWPFTWRSLQGFFGAVIGPLIPIIITLIKWLFE